MPKVAASIAPCKYWAQKKEAENLAVSEKTFTFAPDDTDDTYHPANAD